MSSGVEAYINRNILGCIGNRDFVHMNKPVNEKMLPSGLYGITIKSKEVISNDFKCETSHVQ